MRKTNRFACRANHLYNLALSRPDKRGVSRSSRTRDGMRWTRRHRKTNDAGLRTAKSCGPDAPTLASSLAETIREATVAKSPVTGESTKEAVKTIARGMPGNPGEPVVTNSSCFLHFAREAAGALGTRQSLRPLFSRGKGSATTRALSARRECESVRAPNITGVVARTHLCRRPA